MADLFFLYRKQRIEKKQLKEKKIESQTVEPDKKTFRQAIKKSENTYNLTQTARVLGVHRQTLYYWIKKGWMKPKRDYRNYPIFTVLDIEALIKWQKAIRVNDTLFPSDSHL